MFVDIFQVYMYMHVNAYFMHASKTIEIPPFLRRFRNLLSVLLVIFFNFFSFSAPLGRYLDDTVLLYRGE